MVDRSPGPPSKLAQVPSARCWERIHRAACSRSCRVEDAEELAQQQVFGVHRDVRAQFALPPAVRSLPADEVVAGRARPPPRRPRSRARASATVTPAASTQRSRSTTNCASAVRSAAHGRVDRQDVEPARARAADGRRPPARPSSGHRPLDQGRGQSDVVFGLGWAIGQHGLPGEHQHRSRTSARRRPARCACRRARPTTTTCR